MIYILEFQDPETGDALIREFCSKVTKEGLKATSPGLLWATHSRMKACGERVYSEYPVWVTMYQVRPKKLFPANLP